jgi:hypothetical protein
MSKNDDNTDKQKSSKAKPANAKKNVLSGLNIHKLSNMRIIQKHLVYVIGLSSTLANKEVKIINNIDIRKVRIFWSIWHNIKNSSK